MKDGGCVEESRAFARQRARDVTDAAGESQFGDERKRHADKTHGLVRYDPADKMNRSGACIIVDNVAMKGSLVDEEQVTHNPVVEVS